MWHHIENQPIEEIALIDHVDTQLLSDKAVGTVASNNIAGANVLLSAVGADKFLCLLQSNSDTLRILKQRFCLPATNEIDRRDFCSDAVQALFQFRLIEPVGHSPSGRGHALPVNQLQIFQRSVFPVVQLFVVFDG